MHDKLPSVPWKFVCFAFLFFVTVFVFEQYNHRFWLNDFRVYYSAAQNLMEGKAVYGQPFGLSSGYYKYSPSILLLFAPAEFLPFQPAAIIHFWVIALCSVTALLAGHKILIEHLNPSATRHENLVLSASFVILMNHLIRELHLGNVNMILVLLLLLALLFVLGNRQFAGGLLFGITLLFKPYLLLLALPLLFHRKFRALLGTGTLIAGSFLVLVPVSGFKGAVLLHKEWAGAMVTHGNEMKSWQTIEAITGQFLNASPPPAYLMYLIPGLAVVLYSGIFLLWRTKWLTARSGSPSPDQVLVAGFFLLLALIPNLVITDTEHFLFSAPLILMVMGYLFSRKQPLVAAFAILFFLFYAGTSSDLMGTALSGRLEQAGLIGLGNLGIIVVGIWVFQGLQGSPPAKFTRPVVSESGKGG